MNDMRKLMEAIGPADVKDELAELVTIAKMAGLDKAADYVEHVLKADYDSLDMFGDQSKLPVMLRRQAEGVNEDDKMKDDPCWDDYKMVGHKTKDGKKVPNCVPEGVEEFTIEDAEEVFGPLSEELNEAEYQGRTVKLNKPMQGDVKKFKVYVKNDKGNVVKVNFGEKGTKIKKNNPERRKSFRARHNCDNPGPKWKARYWSCRKW